MHNYGHKCFHHLLAKILMILAWVSAVGFWWTEWQVATIGWMYSDFLFKNVVILSLLALGLKSCSCGMMGKKTMDGGKMGEGALCTHKDDCKCGDCSRCK